MDQGEIAPELLDAGHWPISAALPVRPKICGGCCGGGARRSPASPEAERQAEGLIDALVERYRDSGLLDDAAYAAARVQSLHRRGESATKIRARLAAKGVENAVAAEAVLALRGEIPDPDLAAACAFARRRRLGPYRRSAADPKRELGVFARAGFGRQVAERVLACADTDAVEALAGAETDRG